MMYKKIVPVILLFICLIACNKHTKVAIITEIGTIKLELYDKEAPVTTANFLKYADAGKYKNSDFYRVVNMNNQPDKKIKIEVIQGGLEFIANVDSFRGITHETTKETGIKHLDGVISMARLDPGTASTEFFICIGNQPELDFGGKRNPDGQGFAAFGFVYEGMDLVKRIQQMPDSAQMLLKRVKILDIKRIN